MSEYAHVIDNQIKEIVDLQPSLHAQWVSTNNPKAVVYRPVIRQDMPQFDAKTHAADPIATVYPTSVVFGWNVRPKTADEMRQTWTPLEFLGRFTDAELDDIENRRLTDPGVRTFYRTASFAQEVVSDDPRTVAGMDYLQSIGVLTASRKDQILNG
jgi:hypothetical protein